MLLFFFFFFNDTATTEIYTLSLHDALPISTCQWVLIRLLIGSEFMEARAAEILGRETVKPASMRSLPSRPVRTAILPPEPSRTLILRRNGWISILATAAPFTIVGTMPVSSPSSPREVNRAAAEMPVAALREG